MLYYIYMYYILHIYIDMVFATEGSFKIAIESSAE